MYAQGSIIFAVTGTAGSGAFLPELATVVGTDISVVTAVMIGPEYFDDAGIAAAVAVGCLGEVAVGEVLDVAYMTESDTVTVLSDDLRAVVIGVGVQGTGA